MELKLYPVKVPKDLKTKHYNEILIRPEYNVYSHRQHDVIK